MRSEGWWRGLHLPGMLTSCAAVATSQGLRLGLYPSVRELLSAEPISESRPPLPSVMLLSGLLSGSVGYFVAAPLFLLKVRSMPTVRCLPRSLLYSVAPTPHSRRSHQRVLNPLSLLLA